MLGLPPSYNRKSYIDEDLDRTVPWGQHRRQAPATDEERVLLLEELGARDVKTYRTSGNAVFRHRGKDAVRLARRISATIGKSYDFEPLVMLLEVKKLARVISENPFPEAEMRETVLLVCSQCHPLTRITEGDLTAEEWEFTLYDMIARGAPIHEEDIAFVREYLIDNFATDRQ